MNIEEKVEHLVDDIALMREEFGRTRAELRELLGRLGGTSTGNGSPSGQPAVAVPSAAHGVHDKSGEGTRNGGGLSLSLDELRLVLEQTQTGAVSGTERGALSLKRLAQVPREARAGAALSTEADGPRNGSLTLSLGEFAQIMKEAQTVPEPRHVTHGGGNATRTLSPNESASGRKDAREGADQSNQERGHHGGDLTLSLDELGQIVKSAQSGAGREAAGETGMPLPDLPTMLKEAQTALRRNHEAHRPKAPDYTRRKEAGPSLHGDTSDAKAPTRTHGALRAEQIAPRPRPAATPMPGTHDGSHHGSGDYTQDTKLDINLMASLIRWVGSVKRRLGVRHMQPLLDLYRSSGHLPSLVDKAIFHLASLSIMPDDSDYHEIGPYDLIDALQGLHGIIYGSGRLPVCPAVEWDPSKARLWEGSQSGSSQDIEKEERFFASSQTQEEAVYERIKELVSTLADPIPLPTLEEAPAPPPKPSQEGATDGRRAAVGERAPGQVSASQELPTVISSKERSSNGLHGPGGVQKGRTDATVARDGAATTRNLYPSDLAEAEWHRIEQLIPPVKPGGRPCKYERREILNGILYQLRTSCSWRSLPLDLPPWKIVHHYYRSWRDDGTWGPIEEALDGQKNGSGFEERIAAAWAVEDRAPEPADNGGSEDVTPATAPVVAGRVPYG